MESPTYEDEFKKFINSITNPTLLDSIKYTSFKLIYNNNDTIEIDNIFTINTVSDLKLAIYEKFNFEDYAAPHNQLILLKKPIKDGNQMLDFGYDKTLKNPMFVVARKEAILNDFITAEGSKRDVDITFYDDMLLEKRLTKDILHLYFYKDIETYYTGTKPFSEKEFYGRIQPYFPHLRINQEYPNEDDKKVLQTKLKYFQLKKSYLLKIQGLLKDYVPENPFSFAGFRVLKLCFTKNDFDSGVDSLFYELDVNEIRPYLRLMPVGNTPISKIHLKDAENKIPSVYDPNLIKNWSEEKSLTAENDFLLGKISLKTTTLVPYIYATLHVCDDGSFNLNIQPPKDVRKLEPLSEFQDFTGNILEGIKPFNKVKEIPKINQAYLIFSLRIRENKTISKKQFEKRLELFKPFFTEVPPLPNDQPFIMLRYKAVDNYKVQNDILNFLTVLANKKILKDQKTMGEAIGLLADQFQIDLDTARQKVVEWLEDKSEVQVVAKGESKELIPVNNTGIDIIIYKTKNIFTFHLLNINSIENLHRILTMLSLVFNVEDEILSVPKPTTKTFIDVEEKVNEIPKDHGTAIESQEDIDLGDSEDFADDLMFGEMDSDETSSQNNADSLKEEIAKDYLPADKEVEGVVFPKTPKPEITEQVETIKEKGLANFFIKKLQEIDKSLFEYTVKTPSDKAYVQMCAANEMRQPAVLTFEQYDAMRQEYSDDEDVIFQVYPLAEGQKDIVDSHSDPDKIITILRYGSNPRRENYYVCSEYFCTFDEIVVLKDDFMGTKLRHPIKEMDGTIRTTKPKNTCPFCMGKLVTNRKNPGPGETVLQRIPKRGSTKRHVWIDFLKKTTHPDGLQLPCCFVRPSTIVFKESDSGVIKKRKTKIVDEVNEEDLEEVEEIESVSYTVLLSKIEKKYIIGPTDKYSPLQIGERDGPQIGVLPKELNELFEQDPTNIIARIGNPQKILPNSKGFLRVAVENRSQFRNDSFLAAIAPFYLKNSASFMKRRIDDLLKNNARLFTNLNYGNLVLEFFDPTFEIKEVTSKYDWALKNLDVELNANNEFEVNRIIKSFYNFRDFLLKDTKVKEYRQFASLLAQRNLVQEGAGRPGINFIVLDIQKDNSVRVRCPPYGFNKFMENNDIGFLLHHYTGAWEPIFYYTSKDNGVSLSYEYNFVFQKATEHIWPPVVKKIYGEFKKACDANPRIVYTEQSYIKSTSLISLTNLEQTLSKKENRNLMFVGVVRNSYNHIVGAVCSEMRGEKKNNIIVPIVDDGNISALINKNIYLDYEDIDLENVDNTIRIYNQYILRAFPRFEEIYRPLNIITNESNKKIISLKLNSGLYIKVKSDSKTAQTGLNVKEIEELEHEINRSIIFGSNENESKLKGKTLSQKEVEEIYQHLRLTFSNWLAQKGAIVKDNLENDIIFNKSFSLNEKRKRMNVLLSSLIESWLTTEENDTYEASLIRKDCRIIDEEGRTDECSGKCVLVEGEKCKLHVPKKYKDVNLAEYFINRLFDEIIRYSEKRKELFEQQVSKLVFLDEPMSIGDQYVIPENTIEWSDFLRFTFLDDISEKPRFFEEFSQKAPEKIEEEVEPIGVVKPTIPIESEIKVQATNIPIELLRIINPDDPINKTLKYKELTKEKTLVPVLDELNIDAEFIKYNNELSFNRDMLNKLSEAREKPILQINLLSEDFEPSKNITFAGKKFIKNQKIYVLVIMKNSVGFLVKKDKPYLRFENLPLFLKSFIPHP